MTARMPIAQMTPDQEQRLLRIASDAIKAALRTVAPDRDGAHRAIVRGGELQVGIQQAACRILNRLVNPPGLRIRRGGV
jgi:hypothetical protein